MTSALSQPECEAYIQSLRLIPDVLSVGSEKWMKQLQIIEKINAQAHHSVMYTQPEFVPDLFQTYHEKIPVLIQNILAVELWSTLVYPKIQPAILHKSPKASLILHHEAVLLNLLEVLFYHKECAIGASDSLTELADYCYRKVASLVVRRTTDWPLSKDIKREMNLSPQEALEQQKKDVEFRIENSALNVLRFIAEYINDCPLGVMDVVLVKGDLIQLLVELIQKKPWIRTKDGKAFKFEDLSWQEIPARDKLKVTKPEATVWFSLFFLCVDRNCQIKYQWDHHKSETVKKLLPFMTETLLDQLPPLTQLKNVIHTLGITQMPDSRSTSDFLKIQAISEIRVNLMKGQNWEKIAREQERLYFDISTAQLKKELKQFSQIYDNEVYEEAAEKAKCAKCGRPADKRCSQCKSVFYCSADCQRNHWSTHKYSCKKVEPTKQSQQQASMTASTSQQNTQKKVVIEEIDDEQEKKQTDNFDDVD
ncbi:putative zinc finger MYND domain protein [Blattamonas nauphoetae]|uniref:Zinc finger MYND domain protein n=1 Tax=Blattamonas nauphoetae TaxID=2049346 RepID=A0ABQ9Y4N7_9EUKA|nr:putative zinc finger MYND domain protein [Blattamonas nauphoetae]